MKIVMFFFFFLLFSSSTFDNDENEKRKWKNFLRIYLRAPAPIHDDIASGWGGKKKEKSDENFPSFFSTLALTTSTPEAVIMRWTKVISKLNNDIKYFIVGK